MNESQSFRELKPFANSYPECADPKISRLFCSADDLADPALSLQIVAVARLYNRQHSDESPQIAAVVLLNCHLIALCADNNPRGHSFKFRRFSGFMLSAS
jgi:hypothetical protein